MKWSIAGLFSLGFIAAISAVVLVLSLQNGAEASSTPSELLRLEPADPDVAVLIASRDLDAHAVIDASSIEVRTLKRSNAPQGAFADPVQVVGKVLVHPMKKGQAFDSLCFASEGSGLRLASALAPGTRAVSVSLSDAMRLQGLLYPGSIVDVITSMEVDENDGLGNQPVSITLLRGVLVLAVGNSTITSPDDEVEESLSQTRQTVTLMVSPEQAEMLNLAMDEGKVSLALRNPMDAEESRTEGARLAQLSPILARAKRLAQEKEERKLALEAEQRENALERERFAMEKARREMELAHAKLESDGEKQAAPDPGWETLIVRGGVGETKVFERPGAQPQKRD